MFKSQDLLSLVCVCLSVFAVCACVSSCLAMCMCVWSCLFMQINVCIWSCLSMHIYVCLWSCLFMYMCVFGHVCVCVNVVRFSFCVSTANGSNLPVSTANSTDMSSQPLVTFYLYNGSNFNRSDYIST